MTWHCVLQIKQPPLDAAKDSLCSQCIFYQCFLTLRLPLNICLGFKSVEKRLLSKYFKCMLVLDLKSNNKSRLCTKINICFSLPLCHKVKILVTHIVMGTIFLGALSYNYRAILKVQHQSYSVSSSVYNTGKCRHKLTSK